MAICNLHTSHFLVFLCTHNSVARDIGSRCLRTSSHPCFMRSVWSLFNSPLCTRHSLSHLLLHLPDLHLHFQCGLVWREVPCALPRMRSLTLWSTTPLSQIMSPSSSTTTTSQRPLKFSSRSPPATADPRTCMTRRSVTLSSPLLTQEREEPASRRQVYHSHEESLYDRSQNGQKLVTNDCVVWSLTFIIHVNINSIVMWETLPNNADWDCFKTPILQEILMIQNLHQVEHCAFLEVIHLFQYVGCVRNKFQFRTVQQVQKSFPWTQDSGWTVYPRLIMGSDRRSFWKHESES